MLNNVAWPCNIVDIDARNWTFFLHLFLQQKSFVCVFAFVWQTHATFCATFCFYRMPCQVENVTNLIPGVQYIIFSGDSCKFYALWSNFVGYMASSWRNENRLRIVFNFIAFSFFCQQWFILYSNIIHTAIAPNISIQVFLVWTSIVVRNTWMWVFVLVMVMTIWTRHWRCLLFTIFHSKSILKNSCNFKPRILILRKQYVMLHGRN